MAPNTSELLCKLREDERERLISLPQEELADLVLELYDQLDAAETAVRKHELCAVYQTDRADQATRQFKRLTESGERDALLQTDK